MQATHSLPLRQTPPIKHLSQNDPDRRHCETGLDAGTRRPPPLELSDEPQPRIIGPRPEFDDDVIGDAFH